MPQKRFYERVVNDSVKRQKKIGTKHLANHFFDPLFMIFLPRRKLRVIGIIGMDTNLQQFYRTRSWNISRSDQLVASSILPL